MVLNHTPADGNALGGWLVLIDESSPGLAAPVAQHNAKAVGNPGYSAAVCVAKGIANRFFAYLFGRTAPDVTEFIAYAQVIAMAEAVETSFSTLFLEIEEAAGHFTVRAPAFEDTTLDH